MNDTPIYVTQPLLPELDEFLPYLEQIWASKQLTNGGTMHRQLPAVERYSPRICRHRPAQL